ncbi:S-adenosylmethionine:tRNA ribosyltransferase-isomerase [Alicyclobacillus sp. ALC3]|uniref:S-adenosylmethionine:tRNA ribosyltransferase-isomerase n=1 Tax=Alicyclobacillus sp. ALC3 TaxID=2796143 RepID=UPI002378ED5C|nr:S-adenosylmethionine:tRNA ribosyltransferase-isomerase [Alicyclobacillus sp. ALC3]WDL99118.1 S-adenosylmethionine:tRNA ribosyltransferase-isomerase [Alicyclobacillus sp. ALC3]
MAHLQNDLVLCDESILASSAQSKPYDLSLHLSAQPLPATTTPEERGLERDAVRLLVLHKSTGKTQHVRFHKMADYLDPGDVVVVNTSRTLPASLPATNIVTGEPLRIHVALRMTPRTFVVERRTVAGEADTRLFETGEQLLIGGTRATVIGRFHPDSRLWYVETNDNLWRVAEQLGQPIRYGYLQSKPEIEAYQTVFAQHPGSAEMPSAARPFSDRVVEALRQKGVVIADITLHTGVSSHEVTGPLARHPFLPEWFSVSEATAQVVNRANREGRRVIAAGTTVVRALAAATDTERPVIEAKAGWTTIVITPDNPVPTVTGLITGLHDDATSHLAMLYAFVRPDWLRAAYEEAIARGYLWHEFGDSNLIL